MAKGFLHLHTTVVFIFVAIYAYKVFLLVAGKNEQLTKIREKKFIDIVLGSLILVTGGYLFAINPLKETWLIVKVIAVLALIPLAIVAMKKENKVLAMVTLVGFLYFIGVAYTNSLTLTKQKIQVNEDVDHENQVMTTEESELTKGKAVFEAACTSCHGTDGKLMAGGAKDLSISKLTIDERITLIKKGKGLMASYEGRLTEDDIKAVAAYTQTLK